MLLFWSVGFFRVKLNYYKFSWEKWYTQIKIGQNSKSDERKIHFFFNMAFVSFYLLEWVMLFHFVHLNIIYRSAFSLSIFYKNLEFYG